MNVGNCLAVKGNGITMKIEGAIFDFDGTLLDSMFIWDRIGEDYLISRGIKPRENLSETFKSMSLLQAAEYYQNEYGLTDSTDEIMSGVNKMIEHFYIDEVLPKEGVKEFLVGLKKYNVKMCIATATDKHLVEAALRRNQMLDYFSEIFTCTGVGSGKDNHAIYLEALEHLKTRKAATLVFEDALYAVRTAKKAGFIVVGVYDKSEQKNEKTIREKSNVYIKSFAEMGDYLD
jgi:HAD superfamily hydrolase (TIGR01509 family)